MGRSNGILILWAMMVGQVLISPLAALAATPENSGEWSSLLSGDSFEGWNVVIRGQKADADPDHVFRVKDGVVHAYQDTADGATMPFGALITKKEYSQFHLRLEFKWGTKKFAPRTGVPRDAGIIYQVVGPDRVWPQGMECQIQEGDVGDIFAVYSAVTTTIDPKTKDDIDPLLKLKSPVFAEAAEGGVPFTDSSVDNVVRVRRNKDWEHEGWNTVEVIVDGDRAVHLVNGKVNNRCQKMGRPDPENPQRMIPLDKGRILLQAEGAEIQYRNIEIKGLSDSDRALLDPKSH
jgi:hypothetical protein